MRRAHRPCAPLPHCPRPARPPLGAQAPHRAGRPSRRYTAWCPPMSACFCLSLLLLWAREWPQRPAGGPWPPSPPTAACALESAAPPRQPCPEPPLMLRRSGGRGDAPRAAANIPPTRGPLQRLPPALPVPALRAVPGGPRNQGATRCAVLCCTMPRRVVCCTVPCRARAARLVGRRTEPCWPGRSAPLLGTSARRSCPLPPTKHAKHSAAACCAAALCRPGAAACRGAPGGGCRCPGGPVCDERQLPAAAAGRVGLARAARKARRRPCPRG